MEKNNFCTKFLVQRSGFHVTQKKPNSSSENLIHWRRNPILCRHPIDEETNLGNPRRSSGEHWRTDPIIILNESLRLGFHQIWNYKLIKPFIWFFFFFQTRDFHFENLLAIFLSRLGSGEMKFRFFFFKEDEWWCLLSYVWKMRNEWIKLEKQELMLVCWITLVTLKNKVESVLGETKVYQWCFIFCFVQMVF